MTDIKKIKSSEDLKKYSIEELREIYDELFIDYYDEWFPIRYITEECPHCKGEAHIIENFKQIYLQLICFNSECNYGGKIIDQWYKQSDYYCMLISRELKIS